MKHMYSSFTPNRAKLARFCITLATRVSLRAIFSSGYSEEGKRGSGGGIGREGGEREGGRRKGGRWRDEEVGRKERGKEKSKEEKYM